MKKFTRTKNFEELYDWTREGFVSQISENLKNIYNQEPSRFKRTLRACTTDVQKCLLGPPRGLGPPSQEQGPIVRDSRLGFFDSVIE